MIGKSLAGLRIASYARYSSDAQNPRSVADQLAMLRAYAASAGGKVDPALVFSDAAESGRALKGRAGLEKLRSAVREKRVDIVLVEDVSRLSRDLADSTLMFREFAAYGTTIIGCADGTDSSGSQGVLSFGLRALLASHSSSELSARTMRGMRARAAAGQSTGGRTYGYRTEPVVENGRAVAHAIVIEDAEARIVQRIFVEFVAGATYAEIAHGLNDDGVPPPRASKQRPGWCADSLKPILRRTAYKGQRAWGATTWRPNHDPALKSRRLPQDAAPDALITAACPAIVDEATWDAAQRRVDEIREVYNPGGKSKGGRPQKLMFSGLLYCTCGSKMTLNGSKPQYSCLEAKKRGTCDNRVSVHEEEVRDRLLYAISLRLCAPDLIDYARNRIEQRLAELRGEETSTEPQRREIAELDGQIGKLLDALAKLPESEALLQRLSDLEGRRKQLRGAVEAAEARSKRIQSTVDVEAILRRTLQVGALVAERDDPRVRQALRDLIPEGIRLVPWAEGRVHAYANLYPLQSALAAVRPRGKNGEKPVSQAPAMLIRQRRPRGSEGGVLDQEHGERQHLSLRDVDAVRAGVEIEVTAAEEPAKRLAAQMDVGREKLIEREDAVGDLLERRQREGPTRAARRGSDSLAIDLRLSFEVAQREPHAVGVIAVCDERNEVPDALLGSCEPRATLGYLGVRRLAPLAKPLREAFACVLDGRGCDEQLAKRIEDARSRDLLADRERVAARAALRAIGAAVVPALDGPLKVHGAAARTATKQPGQQEVRRASTRVALAA